MIVTTHHFTHNISIECSDNLEFEKVVLAIRELQKGGFALKEFKNFEKVHSHE